MERPLLRAMTWPVHLLYGLYAWGVFLALALLSLPFLLLLPTLAARRWVIRGVARVALTLAGMPLSIQARQPLPERCITVANHASYLDGVVLCAVLPPRFGFVIKREMSAVPLAGWLLSRIGSQFVERTDRRGTARDARRLMRQAEVGECLAFFPEGTFSEVPGLMRFHIGAFAAAIRGRLPIVPIALRDTRRRLPPGGVWPRPGRIRVLILAPIDPDPAHPDSATALRDAAREQILLRSGEADLAGTG
jgi:1-acyl-sn-glycerol-3-phosphate acyltransferase